MTVDLYVVAIMTSKPQCADELRELLLPAIAAFRDEDGCLSYALHEDIRRPGRFVTYERWRDEKALASHMQSPTMKEVAPRMKDLLAIEMEQRLLDTLLDL